tara:strand:+ start:3036 stop:3299 length:264 start_codon:yes stop_codon:yes gene_type:complete
MSDKKRYFYLYTIPDCPFCIKAKELIEERGHSHFAWQLTSDHQALGAFKEKADWKTVPMVFEYEGRDHKFVGGYDDLVILLGKAEDE